MRGFLLSFVFLGIVSTASAQTLWSPPEGGFTVSFPDTWSDDSDSQIELKLSADNYFGNRGCVVRRLTALFTETQAEANDIVAKRDVGGFFAERMELTPRIVDVRREREGELLVTRVVLEYDDAVMGAPFREYSSIFAVQHESGAIVYLVLCNTTIPVQATHDVAIAALMGSIVFTEIEAAP
jgi:hypothetical protein